MARIRLGASYVRLWTASTVSNLGDGVTLAALPLLAASLTRSPTSIAAVSLAGTLPGTDRGRVADAQWRALLLERVCKRSQAGRDRLEPREGILRGHGRDSTPARRPDGLLSMAVSVV